MTPEMQQPMTVQEVALILRVKPETVQRLIRLKKLKAINIGGRSGYRITQEQLQEYMKEQSTRPAA